MGGYFEICSRFSFFVTSRSTLQWYQVQRNSAFRLIPTADSSWAVKLRRRIQSGGRSSASYPTYLTSSHYPFAPRSISPSDRDSSAQQQPIDSKPVNMTGESSTKLKKPKGRQLTANDVQQTGVPEGEPSEPPTKKQRRKKIQQADSRTRQTYELRFPVWSYCKNLASDIL